MSVLDLNDARDVSRIELDGFIDTIAQASESEWNAPTTCAGWQVRDLSRHVAWIAPMLGTALTRLVEPDFVDSDALSPDTPLTDKEIVAEIRRGRAILCHAFQIQTPASLQSICDVPFGAMPGFMALQLIATELAVHYDDLLTAIGKQTILSERATIAANAILKAALPVMARFSTTTVPPDSRMAFTGHQHLNITIAHCGDHWEIVAPDTTSDVVLSADDSTLTRFLFGRLPLSTEALKVVGDHALATKVKEYFPGP